MRPMAVKYHTPGAIQLRLEVGQGHVVKKHAIGVENIGRENEEVSRISLMYCRIYTIARQKSSYGDASAKERVLCHDHFNV